MRDPGDLPSLSPRASIPCMISAHPWRNIQNWRKEPPTSGRHRVFRAFGGASRRLPARQANRSSRRMPCPERQLQRLRQGCGSSELSPYGSSARCQYGMATRWKKKGTSAGTRLRADIGDVSDVILSPSGGVDGVLVVDGSLPGTGTHIQVNATEDQPRALPKYGWLNLRLAHKDRPGTLRACRVFACNGQSIPGTTRSGGRWPSANVLMLMITFSPISIRPSTVADPICGNNTTFGSSRSRGLISVPCS